MWHYIHDGVCMLICCLLNNQARRYGKIESSSRIHQDLCCKFSTYIIVILTDQRVFFSSYFEIRAQ
jgi:hypothetical protein